MPITSVPYNDGLLNIGIGMDLSADTFKIALLAAAYTPNVDGHTTYADLTNELAGTGNYTAGGATLANVTWVADDTNDRAVFDADNPTWTSLTMSSPVQYAVVYNTTDSDNLVFYLDFGTTVDSAGGNFTITISDSGMFYVGA